MLEIAIQRHQGGIFQKEIATNQHISYKYLDQIISALKTAELIANVKGKKSGYKLTRDADDISIYDIHNAFEPGICLVECLSDTSKCKVEDTCATKKLYSGLNLKIIEYLKAYTLQDLVNEQIKLDKTLSKEETRD